MSKEIIVTHEGLKKLEQEFEHLKTVKRKEVADKIKVALSFGDLSENSEYDEAKNEQAMVEARISQLEAMLKNVKVLDEDDVSTDKISIGSKVIVKDLEFNEEEKYYLVGSTEADPMQGKISDESPIGAALMGKSVGDIVEVEAPGGVFKLEIIEIGK